MMALGAFALVAIGAAAPVQAEDLKLAYVTPAELTPTLAAARQQPAIELRPSFATSQPALTNDLLAAYVKKQQELKSFSGFDVPVQGRLTEQVLLGYIDRTRGTPNQALDAIDSMADQPALTNDVLSTYAKTDFVPTVRKVKTSNAEKLCLTQAIYHEARGESEEGQWAVANVIINRAMSKKFPTTLCGVVFQNADQGYHRCQFTFACDGRSDMGTETGAWSRATRMAATAYSEFKQGQRPGVIPNSALYYHTTAVNPDWGPRAKRVAVIGAHEFYALN